SIMRDLIVSCRIAESDQEMQRFRRQMSGLIYLLLAGRGFTRAQYTDYLIKLYGGSRLDYFSVFGEFFPIDFSRCTVNSGVFEGFGQFGKCTFPAEGTVFFNTLANVDPGELRLPNAKLFDTASPISDKLRRVMERGQLTVSDNIQELRGDLQRVIKVGFQGGGFVWKSENVYKKVTLRGPVQREKFIRFLMDSSVMQRVPAEGKAGFGYVVSAPFRVAAKNLIENSVLSGNLEKIAKLALTEFYGN
ncbi:MAG TPA: hypothetical protein VL992_06190, partial [Tepidisphaeraceae bacterium]|nr:hypothetical protein [Tepidisphaeraceae bacterium]